MSTEGSLNSKSTHNDKPSRIAVTLQSSFLGFASHAGFLNALLDSGIRPDKIAGSSSGALVASAYAAGLEQSQLKDFVLNRKLINSFWEWRILLRTPAVFGAYLGNGVVSGNAAVEYLRNALPLTRIEKAPNAQLSIAVTNLTRMQRQLVQHGDVAAYVIASCAVAPIIRAQKIDGELLLDGGFTDAAPFEQWIDDANIDTILIHNIKFDPPVTSRWSKYTNFISYWAAAHQIVENELAASRIARARAAGKRVIVHETLTARPRIFSSQKHFPTYYKNAHNNWTENAHLLAIQ